MRSRCDESVPATDIYVDDFPSQAFLSSTAIYLTAVGLPTLGLLSDVGDRRCDE
jgi:hypothetical protein